MSALFRRADLVVVALAVAAVAAAAVSLWAPAGAAEWLEIRAPNGVERIALGQAGRHEVHGRIGASVVEVRDGRARFVDAPCRNRVCVAAGWLVRGDDFAACVPNGVSMRVRGAAVSYDAIAY